MKRTAAGKASVAASRELQQQQHAVKGCKQRVAAAACGEGLQAERKS
jgi:hypothetical protein